MQKEDWARLARMIGYVYIPIVLLVVFIFVLVQYQPMKIESAKKEIDKIPTPVGEIQTEIEIKKI